MLRQACLAVLLCCLALAARAQPFPALYDVIDVASNDVLNIRAEPSATSPIIGALAPNASGVEIVRLDDTGRWARVRAAEQMGWASTRFLALVPRQGDGFGQGLTCFGTEPFWTLRYSPFEPSALTLLGDSRFAFDLAFPQQAQGRTDVYGLSGSGTAAEMAGILQRQMCTDGMSDIEYALSLNLILRAQDDLVFAGCCSLGAN